MTESKAPRVPKGLGVKGTRLWREMHAEFDEFNPAETVLVEEACRMADRLDRLNALLVGDTALWEMVELPSGAVQVFVTGALAEARQQANVLKQIVTALRLPDENTGRRPIQRNNGARGAHSGASVPREAKVSATVTALDRARAARQA